MDNCIFCNIASHKIPKEFIYEDADIMVFPDIHPVKPVHVLIVPKKHFKDFTGLTENEVWNKVREVAQEMIQKFQLSDKGFRLSVNGGGGQQIDHFHMHLLGPTGKAV